jgi:hypothetical protein
VRKRKSKRQHTWEIRRLTASPPVALVGSVDVPDEARAKERAILQFTSGPKIKSGTDESRLEPRTGLYCCLLLPFCLAVAALDLAVCALWAARVRANCTIDAAVAASFMTIPPADTAPAL